MTPPARIFARLMWAIFLLLLRVSLWFAVLVALWWSAGALLQWPAREPVPADAVVMLGGGNGERYALSKALVQQGAASRLLLINPTLSDMRDVANSLRDAEVHGEAISRSSWDEAVNTRRWMEETGVRHVLVVSDPPHMLRLAYTWWSVFRGSDLDYTLVATTPRWWSAWRWWDNEQAAQFAGFEVLKLGYYIVRYRFGWGFR